MWPKTKPAVGSPLRMRGKVVDYLKNARSFWITPAYAGKSRKKLRDFLGAWDHPCVCGEKISTLLSLELAGGSPLRMRGKVREDTDIHAITGITPAYAGKRATAAMHIHSR